MPLMGEWQRMRLRPGQSFSRQGHVGQGKDLNFILKELEAIEGLKAGNWNDVTEKENPRCCRESTL